MDFSITRRFLNYESRLLSQSHTLAIIVAYIRFDLIPVMVICENLPIQGSLYVQVNSHGNTLKYVDTVTI